jgi:hypothetical protein
MDTGLGEVCRLRRAEVVTVLGSIQPLLRSFVHNKASFAFCYLPLLGEPYFSYPYACEDGAFLLANYNLLNLDYGELEQLPVQPCPPAAKPCCTLQPIAIMVFSALGV